MDPFDRNRCARCVPLDSIAPPRASTDGRARYDRHRLPGGGLDLPAGHRRSDDSLSRRFNTGDTLAAIALREYKRVSPRLLDEICRNNGLKNANFLNLGQKINLPNYQAQPTQMAVTPQGQVH